MLHIPHCDTGISYTYQEYTYLELKAIRFQEPLLRHRGQHSVGCEDRGGCEAEEEVGRALRPLPGDLEGHESRREAGETEPRHGFQSKS